MKSVVAEIDAERSGRHLRLSALLPAGIREAELRIRSSRNDTIPRLTDTSPHAPAAKADASTQTLVTDEQIWFPVVDVDLIAGMSALATFGGAAVGNGATFAVNGMFHTAMMSAAPEVRIAGADLEYWENSVFIVGDCSLTGFAVAVPLVVLSGSAVVEIDLLSDDWSGSVEICTADGAVVARAVIAAEVSRPAIATAAPSPLDPARLQSSLDATTNYLVRSQVPRSASPVSGGMFLFYDHDARTFRTSHWNWSWGPPIKLLLEAADQSVDAGRAGALRGVADDFGRASLNFQIIDPRHAAYGFSTVRWSPGLKNTRQAEYVSPSSASFPVAGWAPSHAGERFEAGFEGYVSPADTLYLAGWGWVPLGETGGDGAYIDAARLVVDASDRLLANYEIVPQDFPLLVGEWTDYTREEAGFGMEGFSELYRVTGEEAHRRAGEKYIDGILDKLERPDGLWHRHWWRSRQTTTPCEFKSRSLGWGEMGLLAAHRMSPERGYLEKAARLAEHFVSAQTASGAWGLVINRPIGDTQESAKGTALWSMLLYRLHRQTGDKRHLEAARRGLRWLLDQQYLGSDPDGHGGVISCSPFSGVDYRRWFKLSCGYTSAFFGLAVLDEMRISGQAP